MKVIIGLGNPGKKYEKTRHNIGFMAIDRLAEQLMIRLTETKFKSIYGSGIVNGEKVFLIKPQTFMNLSGESVRPFLEYFKLTPDDILVLYDDLDLPTGHIRLREKGGHGGHNGIRSLIQHLGTKEFKKIRLGIGRPTTPIPIVDYVLQDFSKAESKLIEDLIYRSADACEAWLHKPFIDVMNIYNKK